MSNFAINEQGEPTDTRSATGSLGEVAGAETARVGGIMYQHLSSLSRGAWAEDEAGTTATSTPTPASLERPRTSPMPQRAEFLASADVVQTVQSIVRIRPPAHLPQHSQLLQQWEGTVDAAVGDSFDVRLHDLLDSESPEEFATLSLDEVSESDRALVQVGAVFYWSISYVTDLHRQRRTTSTIYFRRLPAWNENDLARARQAAEKYRALFSDDSST